MIKLLQIEEGCWICRIADHDPRALVIGLLEAVLYILGTIAILSISSASITIAIPTNLYEVRTLKLRGSVVALAITLLHDLINGSIYELSFSIPYIYGLSILLLFWFSSVFLGMLLALSLLLFMRKIFLRKS